MKNNSSNIIDFSKFDIIFEDKPIIFGGMAMDYYGIRTCGNDMDCIVSNRDYLKLDAKYRDYRKDMWGNFGVSVHNCDLFRSILKLDYSYFDRGAIELEQYKIVSIDILFQLKVFAMAAEEKHKTDVELIKQYLLNTYQNKEYVDYANKYTDRYLKAENGMIFNGDYY
ncbi:MAG: hypothetical protein LBU91_00020 [Bacteroidales bacterium]|nr:hypothetical protein [Bacteroidales bacterium]